MASGLGVTPRGPQADAFALGGVGRVGRLKITTPRERQSHTL